MALANVLPELFLRHRCSFAGAISKMLIGLAPSALTLAKRRILLISLRSQFGRMTPSSRSR
jgi:hypothetical protein